MPTVMYCCLQSAKSLFINLGMSIPQHVMRALCTSNEITTLMRRPSALRDSTSSISKVFHKQLKLHSKMEAGGATSRSARESAAKVERTVMADQVTIILQWSTYARPRADYTCKCFFITRANTAPPPCCFQHQSVRVNMTFSVAAIATGEENER